MACSPQRFFLGPNPTPRGWLLLASRRTWKPVIQCIPWNDGTNATSCWMQFMVWFWICFDKYVFFLRWLRFLFPWGLVSEQLRFCDRCMTNQGVNCCPTMDYRNIGPSAAWPLTSISHETYMKLDSHCISPWEKMPGFHFRTICHDWMHHTYLGTARALCGSGTFPWEFFLLQYWAGSATNPFFLDEAFGG